MGNCCNIGGAPQDFDWQGLVLAVRQNDARAVAQKILTPQQIAWRPGPGMHGAAHDAGNYGAAAWCFCAPCAGGSPS